MAVAILPYGKPGTHRCDLGGIALEEAGWPLGDRPAGKCLADLSHEDHLILYASSKCFSANRRGLKCRVSLLLMEPPIIQGRYYFALRFRAGAFHRVLTHNTDLLTRLPNARFLAHGGTFLNTIPEVPQEKPGRVALIASKKRDTPGQKLRHALADWSRANRIDLDLFGYGYQPLEDKGLGHLPYQFSVVIENSRTPGYFTEKLIDSLLCGSVPLYWGAPDIEHFFDPRGLIICRSLSELQDALRRVGPQEYSRRLEYVGENRRRAMTYLDCLVRAAELLRDEDQML